MGSFSPETSLRGMFSRRKEKIRWRIFGSQFFDERNHRCHVDVQKRPGRPFLSPPKKSAPRRPRCQTSHFAEKKTLRGLPRKASENKEKEWWNKIRFHHLCTWCFFSGTKIPFHHLGPAKIRFFGGSPFTKRKDRLGTHCRPQDCYDWK